MELEAKRQFTDLRSPWMWYKAARQMTRKIIIHTGPTNSGKTFHALERYIKQQEKGTTRGPKRQEEGRGGRDRVFLLIILNSTLIRRI